MTATRSKMARRCAIILVALFFLALYSPAGWLEFARVLTFGSVGFLRRVLPAVHINSEMFLSALVYVAAALAIGHILLRWFFRETAGQRWKFSWTLGLMLLVLVAFASGLAAIGLARQSFWLVRSKQPLFAAKFPDIHCAMNLRCIGMAIDYYANDHNGQLPADLAELARDTSLLDPSILTCPAQSAAPVAQRRYIYCGMGLNRKQMDHPEAMVIVTESPANHMDRGITALYADGHVDALSINDAAPILIRLGFKPVKKRSDAR